MEENGSPQIPGFRLLSELGRGGSARVFLAEKSDGKRFALKVFHSSAGGQADTRRRVLGEWKAASTQEPGLVCIHDFLELPEHLVLVMEYVEGISLADFQSRLPYVLPEVSVLIAIEILKALEGVHARGIVHRDLKPSNVMVERTGKVLLTDFGLAKWTDASAHTLHGSILGSPDFMSPEQAQGDVVGPLSDLFSLSSILYFLVTGTKPFSRTSPLATLAAVVKGEIEAPGRRNPKISPALSRLLQKGMSPALQERFPSAQAFREALEAYLRDVGFPTEISLVRWIECPSECTMEALRSVAERLTENARRLLAQGKRDEATTTLAHLSLVAPDSLALQELMLALEKNPSRKRAAAWLALSAGVLLLLGFGFYHWMLPSVPLSTPPLASSSAPAPLPTPSPPPAPSTPVGSEVVAVADTVKEVSPAPVRKRSLEKPRTAAVARRENIPASPRLQRVSFSVPEGVEVEWNGIAVPLDRPFRAAPGIHDVLFRKEGFRPIHRQIEVKADEPTVIKVN